MAVTLYGKEEGWFETSPYGVMADRYGSEPGGGGFGNTTDIAQAPWGCYDGPTLLPEVGPLEIENVAEVVGIVRDVILILAFLVAALALVLVYRKLSSVLDSAGRTLKNAEELSSTISSNLIGRAKSGTGVASGAGKVAAFILSFARRMKKKRGDGDGE